MVLNKVKEGKGSRGYNAATGEYGDLLAMGILDPTKVTRTALQDGAGPHIARVSNLLAPN